MKFNTLELHEKMLQGIEDAGFEKCTPVQEQALPESIKGQDIIVQSQTGTGKTAVFITTIYNRLIEGGKERPAGARALVMAPTRELAVQIDSEAKKLAAHLPFRSIAIYGGVEYEKQTSALKEGVDLVVATPGRMIDLYKSKSLSLKDIEIFVVDEADRMFDMGFAPDISYIASRLPKGKDRQTMLFSATIDENVHRLAARYMKPEPVVVEIEPEQVTVDKIDQKVLYPSNDEKLVMLMALLRRPDVERAIIFANMKRTVEMLEWKLSKNDFLAMGLTGDVSQSKRQRIIDDMKTGKLKILVATDVVARGLHVEDITHVYNYDLPQEAASYVHRIGRTARAGKSGKAYSLVCEDHAFNLPEIEKYIERKIPAEWIDEEEMVADKAGPYRKRSPRPTPGGKGGKSTGSGRSGGSSQRSGSSRGGRKPDSASKGRDGASVKSGAKSGQGSASSSKPGASRQAAPKDTSKEKKEVEATASAESTDNNVKDSSARESAGETKRPRRRRGRRGGAGRKEAAGSAAEAATQSEASAKGKTGEEAAAKSPRAGTGRSGSGPSRAGAQGQDSRRPRSRSRSSKEGAGASQNRRSASGSGRRGASKSAESSSGAALKGTRAALIESQTGGAATTAAPSTVAAKPKKSMLKRILNVFGKK